MSFDLLVSPILVSFFVCPASTEQSYSLYSRAVSSDHSIRPDPRCHLPVFAQPVVTTQFCTTSTSLPPQIDRDQHGPPKYRIASRLLLLHTYVIHRLQYPILSPLTLLLWRRLRWTPIYC
ncbi:hypothetical protein V8E53_012899 [Lactarius tabidus]